MGMALAILKARTYIDGVDLCCTFLSKGIA
jgi:hypothetical protein